MSAIFKFVFANLIEKATHVTLFKNLSRNPDKKVHPKFAEKNAKFDAENEKIGNSIIQSRKNVDDFWLFFFRLKNGAKECIV